MKIKTLLFFILGLGNICPLSYRYTPLIPSTINQKNIHATDSIKMILDLNTGGNPITKGMSMLWALDFYNDTLYMVNDNKLVQFSLKTGSISTNSKVNAFLANRSKSNAGIERMIIQKDGYYFSSFNKIYFIGRNGTVKQLYDNVYLINDFNIVNDNIILAGRTNIIKVLSKNASVLSSMTFELVDAQYIDSNNGLYYAATPETKSYEFTIDKNFKVEVKEYPPLVLTTKGIKEPFISLIYDKYLIIFDYWDRRNLFIYKKGDSKNELYKKISLNENFKSSMAIMRHEEGKPDFRIKYYNGEYYIIALVNGQLKIRSFTF